MHIYVLNVRDGGAAQCGLPIWALRSYAESLESAGCRITLDVRTSRFGEQLSPVGDKPDIVHCFGAPALAQGVRWQSRGTPRLVASFDDAEPPESGLGEVAERVDAVMPLSECEDVRWRSRNVSVLSFGGVPALPFLPHPPAETALRDRRTVVAMGAWPHLCALMDLLPGRPNLRLHVLGQSRQAWRLHNRARKLGVSERFSMGSVEDSFAEWPGAAVFAVGSGESRHGATASLAASYGVPSVAFARGAHVDCVVDGLTGRLLDPRAGAQGMACEVARLLDSPFILRARGEACRARALSLQQHAGHRVRSLYEGLVHPEPPPSEPAGDQLPACKLAMVLEHLPYASQLARRYTGRGQSLDDLTQVASLGLINAVNRFDPADGHDFYSFATPTILGELRRHFRDHAWLIRVPRTLQETSLQVQRVADDRAMSGLPVTACAIAGEIGIEEEEVLHALQAYQALSADSLDMPLGAGGDESVADLVGGEDPRMTAVENAGVLDEAMAAMPERTREMVLMRYFGERKQSEIAECFGISQVQVSRILSHTLADIRQRIMADREPELVDLRGAQ